MSHSIVFAVLAAFSAPLLSQNLQAALIALDPVEASWLNAPAGTVGATDSSAQGLLTSVHVAAPIGSPFATFDCQLTPAGDGWTLTASSEVELGVAGGLYATHADLLLGLWSITPTVVAIELETRHLGDWPQDDGFAIDIDADGSSEVTVFNTNLTHRFYATLPIDGELRLLRVRSENAPYSPQRYELTLHAREWLPIGTAQAPDCGSIGVLNAAFGPVFATNHQLALLPPTVPGTLGRLVAHGLGSFQVFLIGTDPAMTPLTPPLPWSGSCAMLADPFAVLPGGVVGSWPGWHGSPFANTDWQLDVPPLPAGLELYVQAISANDIAPVSFGASNVIRIDS